MNHISIVDNAMKLLPRPDIYTIIRSRLPDAMSTDEGTRNSPENEYNSKLYLNTPAFVFIVIVIIIFNAIVTISIVIVVIALL